MIRGARLPFVIGLVAALVAPPAWSQEVQLLKNMSGSRGMVVHGKGGFLGALPGTGPFTPIAGDLGRSVATVDLNGDGFDELVCGAPLLPTAPQSQVLNEAGHVYVIFGSAAQGAGGSSPKLELDPIASGTVLNLVGDPGDQAGASVAAAGDVNGDGFQDVVIGTPMRTVGGRVQAGGAYIVFGAADLATLPADWLLSQLASAPFNRALFVQGARVFGAAGSSVSGDVDVNADGRSDVVLGAPLDSTFGHSENGTATVLYGQPGFPGLHSLDLAALAAGQGTSVHGSASFQFLGFSVAGLGRFDAVLPMTDNATNPALGDDVALGAPGTPSGAQLFAGATYVLRGVDSGSHALSYAASDFGNGPFKAGVIYLGAASGDQAGSSVARIGPLDVGDAAGSTQLAISAPFHDGIGKADSGTAYIVYGGAAPQGVDLAALSTAAGVTIWGPTTAGGQRGVSVSDAGDFNTDGLRDIAIGHPNATLVVGPNAYVGAGRMRILDGALLYASALPVYLGNFSVPWALMQFSGENAGDFAGSALGVGDLNGDSDLDLAVGSPGAASDPKPQDPTGISRFETGRTHVVYGAALRLDGVSPSTTWFGGPAVTITAAGVPDSVAVTVEGQPVTVLALVPGAIGSISFVPPPPLVFGQLADVAVASGVGNDELPDALQFAPLAVTTGPTPATGFAGGTIAFTGQAFSTLADTDVTIGGLVAGLIAIDGLAGTLSVEVPSGLLEGVPADVVIENSNGSVTLPGGFTYEPILLGGLQPAQGPQTSGVFVEDAVPFAGQPASPIAVEVQLEGGGPLPVGDLVIEFGTETLGYRQGLDPKIVGDTVTVGLPPFLLGPQDTVVDVRARLLSTGDASVLPGAFTYLASDFTELDEFRSPGIGPDAPASLMAGQLKNGAGVLLLMNGWKGTQSLGAVLFFGTDLAQPPLRLQGGLLGVQPQPEFTFLLPGGLAQMHISQTMPTDMPPSADGTSLYLQVVTKESSGGISFGFSNVLQMTINLP